MKFEKFFKSAGTHGQIVKRNESESWLVCGGVGMRIPTGINNLGVSVEADKMFKALLSADTTDDVLVLEEAVLKDPEGKANDIIRVFGTDYGDKVGIYNADYGLLEKKDLLTYLEIEDDEDPDDVKTVKFIVVLNHDREIVGFISGTNEI